jgi:hypothetical protein
MAASERRKSLLSAAKFAVALWLAMLAVPCIAGSPDRYTALVYDILLLRQCGLADRTVENGFRLEVHELTGDGDAAPDTYAAARDAGVARYESEVRNRGSGAADPRCRTDAVAAAVRFRAVIDAE